MTYQANSIPEIRTVKVLRGEAFRIDLGKTFSGTLRAWMKRSPNDLEYRSFEIQSNRYLYLSADKASDYYTDGVLVSAVEGKWYFDVEQIIAGEDIKTIYRGTIQFQNDITGSRGEEIPAPTGGFTTYNILLVDSVAESLSGLSVTQEQTNIEFVNELKRLSGKKETAAYQFQMSLASEPTQGKISISPTNFATASMLFINKTDLDGINNAFFIEKLASGAFLTFTDKNSTDAVVFEVTGEPVLSLSGEVYEITVEVNSQSGTIFENLAYLEIDGLITQEGGGVITEEVTVFGVGTVGGYEEGDVILQGTPVTGFVKKLLQKLIALVYPTAGLNSSPSSTQEIGATVSFTLTPSFVQNDGGALSSVVFKRDLSTIRTQTDLSQYVDSNRIVQAGNNTYNVEISYLDGEADPQKDGIVPSGTVTAQKIIAGAYRNWFGPYGATPPMAGSDIRAIGYSYLDSFVLNTGASALIHVIAVPSTKSLLNVIDQDASFANITSAYVLSGTLNTVPDGGGNNVAYKVYILTLSVPYSSNHRHNITIG